MAWIRFLRVGVITVMIIYSVFGNLKYDRKNMISKGTMRSEFCSTFFCLLTEGREEKRKVEKM